MDGTADCCGRCSTPARLRVGRGSATLVATGALLLVLAIGACSGDNGGTAPVDATVDAKPDLAAEDAGVDGLADTVVSDSLAEDDGSLSDAEIGPTHLHALASPLDFDLLKSNKAQVKYLLSVDGRQAPAPLDKPCTFQNGKRFDYHLPFILQFPQLKHIDFDAYVKAINFRATRFWWAGALLWRPAMIHPKTNAPGVLLYVIWREPQDGEELTVEEFVQVDQRLKGCAPYATDLLALTGGGDIQQQHIESLKAQLAADGVSVVSLR